jgi:hypothetical protein
MNFISSNKNLLRASALVFIFGCAALLAAFVYFHSEKKISVLPKETSRKQEIADFTNQVVKDIKGSQTIRCSFDTKSSQVSSGFDLTDVDPQNYYHVNTMSVIGNKGVLSKFCDQLSQEGASHIQNIVFYPESSGPYYGGYATLTVPHSVSEYTGSTTISIMENELYVFSFTATSAYTGYELTVQQVALIKNAEEITSMSLLELADNPEELRMTGSDNDGLPFDHQFYASLDQIDSFPVPEFYRLDFKSPQ